MSWSAQILVFKSTSKESSFSDHSEFLIENWIGSSCHTCSYISRWYQWWYPLLDRKEPWNTSLQSALLGTDKQEVPPYRRRNLCTLQQQYLHSYKKSRFINDSRVYFTSNLGFKQLTTLARVRGMPHNWGVWLAWLQLCAAVLIITLVEIFGWKAHQERSRQVAWHTR